MFVRKGRMSASGAFSDGVASEREPGTSRFSAIGIADALGIQFQDLAALAGVHRNTLRTHPESPRLQTALRDLMRVLSAAAAVQPDTARAFFMVKNEPIRSEEHTSELQSLMRTSYAVCCLK